MCIINQKPVKSPKIGYKVCNLKSEGYGIKILTSPYWRFIWKKGINREEGVSKYMYAGQAGFHCFTSLKNAMWFAKKYKKARAVTGDLAVIKVILTNNVRKGKNAIDVPCYNFDPCYVGLTAKWNGKILKTIKGE